MTSMFGMSRLDRNDGQGRFDDVIRKTFERPSFGAIGCKTFDFNNDGRLDLLIADMHSDMWIDRDAPGRVEPAEKFPYLHGPMIDANAPFREEEGTLLDHLGLTYDDVLFGNSLFRNDGAGRFTEMSDAAGVETFWPWGVAVGDFDNGRRRGRLPAVGHGLPVFLLSFELAAQSRRRNVRGRRGAGGD